MKTAGAFGRAIRASARFAVAALRRTIGKTRTATMACLTGDGWLRTGDLATRNRLGLIRIVGRMKDVIKSGGYSVYVRELEEAILAHPAVARAVAFGLPHKEKGEVPAAAVDCSLARRQGESRPAGVVQAASRRLQSAAPHLDSRTRRLAAESQRQVSRRVLRERFLGKDRLEAFVCESA